MASFPGTMSLKNAFCLMYFYALSVICSKTVLATVLYRPRHRERFTGDVYLWKHQ